MKRKVDSVDICVGKMNKLCVFPKQNFLWLAKVCVDLAAHKTLLPNDQYLFTKV